MSTPRTPFELIVGNVDLTVPRDMLMPLQDAVDLPRLGGLFKLRDLRRYASPKRVRNRLPAVQPGREWLTTPAWIDDWIDEMKGGTPAPVGAPPAGLTGTPHISAAAAAASASLEARLAAKPPKTKKGA